MKKRVLSLLLAVVMVWSLLPTAVLAAGGELAGDGRADSPYQIAGAADLMAFAEMVNGGKPGICAELTANIDLTGEDWVPIGVKGASYSGTFDGKYFTVTLDITADGSYEYEYIGLFGYLENAAIRNLKTDGSIRVTADCQSYPVVGGIAACVGSYSGFTNCKNAIAITVDEGTVLNGNGVGGIVGMMYADATFEQCTNWGDISIGSNAYSMGVGGIAGYSDAVIQISYCYNYADIEYYDDVMGGLIGSCNDITAVGCYSAASAEPHNAPRGLEGKTLSGNDYGDLFGGTSSYTLERMLIYCDQFGAYNNISDDDFDETQISKSNYMSPQEMVEYLNGDDGAIYTADSDIAGGWPVLAWELKAPTVVTNPEEAAYAKAESDFNTAKAAALDALNNGFKTYDQAQYSDTGWASLNSIYNKAKAALNGASLTPYGELEDKSVDAITAYAQAEIDKLMPIAQTALAEMKAVPTKAQETQFVKEKENAIRDLEDAYTNELKELNDLRGEAAAVWHGINGEVLTQLAEKSAALKAALDAGKAKLEACTNTVALDATLRSSQAALSAVLQDFTVSVDSGVADKWDGSSKAQPSGSGTAASPYKLGTAAQLAWFADTVNSGSRSACAVLTADIDLNGQEWTPIANSGVNNGYTGTFDGQGHVIHGICVTTGVSSRPQGLFGIIARTGTVRNVKAAGRVLVRQSSGAGLIAGENNGVLYNCEASAFLKNSYNAGSTGSSDTAKVASYGSPVRADGGTAQKLSATQALLGKLIRFDAKRDGSYAVYGDQSAAYNAVIMDYVRRIEEAADSAVGALLTEADAALSAVPTQLQADKAALLADMRAYAAANIYDTDEQSAMDALLETAAQAIDSAATVAAVAKLRQVYMGTENIDGELAGIKTYPAKAADELYNKYIFDRSYAPEDMAKALRAYEGWKLKLFSAPDLDGVEAVYADARKAMDALTRDFTTGDTAPDMDTAASAARALARQEVLDSLAMLEQGYIDALTAIAGDMDALSYAWKARLTAVLDSGKAALHAAATPALEDIDDYGVLEDKLATGKQALSDIFADVSARLTALAASAANESAWNGTTVEPGKDASGVYQIGTAEELAWLAAEINNSSNNSQSYSAVLTADIDLGYRPWTPIGCYVDWQSNHPYRGVFDGQGHTVSGLYVTALSNGYAGLFGYTSGSTTIKNLTVEGEIRLEDVSTTAKHIGGIVGEANAKLERCVSRVRISAAGFGTRDTCAVGGIAGKLSGAMTDCRFEGSIDITCKRGGAYISGGVGGLAGNAAGGALTRCVNTGAVTVDKGTGVGGIAGITSREVTFTQCANTGHISNDTTAVLSSGEKPKGGTGGILGVGKSGNVSISLCYNTGTVSGTTIVGGILGGEAGDYGTSISNGNPSLTVENCYNAGLLDVGSRTNRIGSLVGFPIAGQYRDGLYVLGSSSRQAKGWFSSQGECITVLDTLTAAAINRTGDMVDSIAQLNSGCPLFMWQLEETASRSAVIAYLRSYYTDNVRTAATPAQRDALETQLAETEAVINAPASKAPAIVEAYETMLSAMNADTLVQAAKDEAKAELNRLKEDSAKTYPAIKDKLKALLDDRLAALDKCKTGAEVQSCVDAFAAGVVDLLIDDAAGARLKELATKLKTIESAYNALDKTRQSLVTKYGKLAGMQQLYKQYTENLEALKKWYGEDCKRYDYIKKTVEKLYNGAVTQLGECTDKAAMDAVMNGYVVDIAEALTGDIAYKPGKTPASALKNLETRIKNARTAYNSLTAEQKQLFDKDLLASLQGAESLLSAYNSGISSLSSRLQQDKKAYPDLSDKLERLASRARNAMDSSVDTSGILSALDRYAASVVDALIDDIGYMPDVMSESDAAVLRGKISRAQSAYNALTAAQKKLVKGVTALETAAARMAAYEENYKAAQRVVEFIKAIGTVTKDSYDAIKRATDAYNALTPVQKALVPQWAIDLLEEATAKYKELTAADDTVSAEQPAELPLDDLRTEEAAKPDRPFDWTIIWMGAGILAALGIIVLLWKWFSATKQTRRRNDE